MNNAMIRQNESGNVMPLLVYYTHATPIEEAEDVKIPYNDVLQITEVEMRQIGTKCLKSSSTRVRVKPQAYRTDKKNEIDDSKYVK